MRMKLTKRAVESLGIGQADILVWDDTLRGFGVKVTPKGARVYLLQYSFGGRSRRVTIGRHGDLTVEQARRKPLFSEPQSRMVATLQASAQSIGPSLCWLSSPSAI